MANQRTCSTWTSIWKQRWIWGSGYLLGHVSPFVFSLPCPTSFFLSRYANSHHDYSFPRVVGILGDGKTKYDYGNDGHDQAIGACSVSLFPEASTYNNSIVLQKANFRRTNVATKLKLTYVKDNFLDVSPCIPHFILTYAWFIRSKFSTKHVSITVFVQVHTLIKMSSRGRLDRLLLHSKN